MKEIIEKLVSKHTLILGKCKTLEDYAKAENNFTNELLKAINYSQCCKSDSERPVHKHSGVKVSNSNRISK